MKQFLRTNLQYFGEVAADGGNPTETATGETSETAGEGSATSEADTSTGGETKTSNDATPKDQPKYTEAELKKFQENLERLAEEKISNAIIEYEKKSKMTDDEKAQYEQEEQAKKLEDREREIAQRELRADTAVLLSEAELPADILDIIIGKDRDSTAKNIEAFKTVFDKAVQTQVEKQLSGSAPPSGNFRKSDTDPFLAGFNG